MKRLVEIQQELKVTKDNFNKFGGFAYRSASQILEKVKPLLAERKLSIVLSDDLECYANRVFLRATAGIYDEDGNCVVSTTSDAELDQHKGMSKEQSTGSASSYARKYALCGLFAIDDSSLDPDAIVTKESDDQKDESKTKITDERKKEITDDALSKNSIEEVQELLRINGIDIKAKGWEDLRKKLNEKFK